MTKERYVVIDHEDRRTFELLVGELLAGGFTPVGGVAVGIIPSGNRAVYTVRYAQALYWPLQEIEAATLESEHAKSNS